METVSTETKIAKEWVGKVAIVTGASAGIGLDLIRVLASNGVRTIGCARNILKIEEAGMSLNGKVGGEITAFKCDVSKEEEVKSMFDMAQKKYGGVDILVNNAGLLYGASILSGATEDWKCMLDVNVLAVCICTREFFQHHKARKADLGYIINISSIVGHFVPSASSLHIYSATKFAVTTITEGTRQELREIKSNIKISQVSPGLVYTEIIERQIKDKEKAEAFYSQKFKENSCLEAGDISEAILFLLSTPPRVCCHEVIIRSLQET